jgi:hypothetical protein
MHGARSSRPDPSRSDVRAAVAASPAAMPLAAAATVLLAGSVFFGGASGDGSVVWIGGAALALAACVLAAASLGRMPLPRPDRDERLALTGLIGLVVWMGVSLTWSVAGDLSWSALNKGIAYVAVLVIGFALAALGRTTTRAIAGLVAAVLAAALGWSLITKAIPALAPDDAVRVARLHSPVGYWNGLALLADAALALGAWLSVALPGRRAVRGAGAALIYLAVLAGLLTTSRAGVLGGLLALGVWLWLGDRRVESAAAAVAAGLPGAVVAGWAFTRPALVDVGHSHAERVHDGAIFAGLALAGLGIAVAAAVVGVPRLVGGRERTVARALVMGAASALVIGVVAVAIAAGNPVTKVTRGFSRGECSNTADRFYCTNNNRLRWWREAGRIFVAKPVGGAGAGTFQVARKRYRTSGDPVTEPHSVPMQVLSGTGIVGEVLLLLFVGAAALGVRRTLASLGGGERAAAVALAGLPAAYLLHGLVDYDADFLALTVPLLLVVGALLGTGRPLARTRAGLVPGLAVAAVAATGIVALALPWLAERRVDASYAASSTGRVARAVDDARSARSLDPLSVDALYALANAYETGGDIGASRDAFRHATRLQPENPETWYQLGLFEFLQTQNMCAAYYALNRSYTLDPNSSFWVRNGPLDRARDAVNEGACG